MLIYNQLWNFIIWGLPWPWGYSKFAGWFISWKIPWMRTKGTPMTQDMPQHINMIRLTDWRWYFPQHGAFCRTGGIQLVLWMETVEHTPLFSWKSRVSQLQTLATRITVQDLAAKGLLSRFSLQTSCTQSIQRQSQRCFRSWNQEDCTKTPQKYVSSGSQNRGKTVLWKLWCVCLVLAI